MTGKDNGDGDGCGDQEFLTVLSGDATRLWNRHGFLIIQGVWIICLTYYSMLFLIVCLLLGATHT